VAGLGKRLTIVDNNPISFVIAHKFFGLPDDLQCMVSDFRKFIYADDTLYDASQSMSAVRVFSSTMNSMSKPAMPSRTAGAGRPHRHECDGHERYRSEP